MPRTLPFLDAITAMTLLAANTTTLKIGSGILELPLHHPVLPRQAVRQHRSHLRTDV
jgi:alkanesulfonate monooxygenase SsuD/methylene tetrahydromethanopterin reductase-like flavin-dependent oxidoreductase (luciferase family)